MARSAVLVDTLKRELRSRGITYAAVASHLGMSEASVKRMFAHKEFTLSRLDRICELAGIEFSELARLIAPQDAVISQLSYEQEKEFVENHKLMLVALCTLNHWSFDEIVAAYDISPAECVKLLAHLDRLKFIELLPNNRIRLLVSRAFAWIPDGPIQRLFKEQFQVDFFRSSFDRDNELLLLANGALSRASVSALLARLRKTAAEFSGMRSDDASLPSAERTPITLLLAARPWGAEFLRKYRRRDAPQAAQSKRLRMPI
jgi:transcriptional regulator with XRE-family HTH domain